MLQSGSRRRCWCATSTRRRLMWWDTPPSGWNIRYSVGLDRLKTVCRDVTPSSGSQMWRSMWLTICASVRSAAEFGVPGTHFDGVVDSRFDGTVAHACWLNWMFPPVAVVQGPNGSVSFLIRASEAKPITAMERAGAAAALRRNVGLRSRGRPRLGPRLALRQMRRGDPGGMPGGEGGNNGVGFFPGVSFAGPPARQADLVQFRGSVRSGEASAMRSPIDDR